MSAAPPVGPPAAPAAPAIPAVPAAPAILWWFLQHQPAGLAPPIAQVAPVPLSSSSGLEKKCFHLANENHKMHY